MDGFLHFLVIHESTQRIRVFLIGKCQCPLSGRRLNFFKRRIAILVNEVCDNGNVSIIARSRYDRQAVYQSGQPISQGFELPAEFLPDDPVYHVNIFGGGFQIQIFVNRPAHFFGKVRPILGGQFIERPNCIFPADGASCALF